MSTEKDWQLTNTLEVTDPSGKSYELEVWTQQITIRLPGNQHGAAQGMKAFKLRDGTELNYESKGKYRHPMTGMLFTSDDPAAE